MESLSPNLFVKDIKKSLAFYKKLGFTTTMSVPDEARVSCAWSVAAESITPKRIPGRESIDLPPDKPLRPFTAEQITRISRTWTSRVSGLDAHGPIPCHP